MVDGGSAAGGNGEWSARTGSAPKRDANTDGSAAVACGDMEGASRAELVGGAWSATEAPRSGDVDREGSREEGRDCLALKNLSIALTVAMGTERTTREWFEFGAAGASVYALLSICCTIFSG